MQTRYCHGCGIDFRVMKSSSQQYHSARCKNFYESEGLTKWVDQKNQKNSEKSNNENTIEINTKQIQSLKPLKSLNKSDIEMLIKKNVLSEERKNIEKTNHSEMSSEKLGQETIKKSNLKHRENIMEETKQANQEKFKKENTEEIQQGDSSKPLMNLEMVNSPSMSLLDDTATHLYGLMKSLGEQSHEFRKLQPHEISIACDCAKNIREIMKLKLEAIKAQREFLK